MKKLFITFALAMISLAGMGQIIGEALYIYRNDGQFNAFFRDEVDSIAYSNFDTDSVYYDEVVTQVVYTADSIYRIPLAAVDSVSFIQPETILQPNVVQMEKKGLMDYLLAVDGMSLLFKTSIPRELQSKIGDVLLCTDFNNPLLPGGFVGKVQATKMQVDAFRVDCDSICDIFEIFEQLISIEKIENERTAASRRVNGEWVSNRNSLDFNLGYSHKLSDGNISLSGFVNGTFIATVTYKITLKEQYINLRIDHDWKYGAHLHFNCERSFGTLFGPVFSVFNFRFPPAAPVFKFQISGAPFVKGEGNMELDFSLNSPTYSCFAEATFRDGYFSGSNTKKTDNANNSASFDVAFSLNGSLQIGCMVDFWLGLDIGIKGIAKNLLKLGTGLDLYIGPKLFGDFSAKFGTNNPVNYYSLYKDSKVGLSKLAVDYEFFGEAAIAGHKFPKGIFSKGSINTMVSEWYCLPEFSNVYAIKHEDYSASVGYTPNRNLAFPLRLGIGLYGANGELIGSEFEVSDYRLEKDNYKITKLFNSLEREKEYEVKPMFMLFGEEYPAFPTEKFVFEKNISVFTLSPDNILTTQARVGGKIENYIKGIDDGEIGFFYNSTTGDPREWNAEKIIVGNLSDLANGEFFSTLTNLAPGRTYYYRAYLYIDNKYIYGESKRFTTLPSFYSCPDDKHPHWIDLELPSGTLWRCCNIGASSPEECGDYCDFGVVTSAPSLEQYYELLDWDNGKWQHNSLNGKFGLWIISVRNGKGIFFPTTGYYLDGVLYNEGSGAYWSSTPYQNSEELGWGFNFNNVNIYMGSFGESIEQNRPVRPAK